MTRNIYAAIPYAVFAAFLSLPAAAQPACDQPVPVCNARAAVFAISSFDPLASAVRIDAQTLVTVRHAVADEVSVDVLLEDGSRRSAQVVPTSIGVDLVLLRTSDLPDGPVLSIGAVEKGEAIHTIGADIAQRTVVAYPPGAISALPAADHPKSRVHHTAFSQPGNSGGALVTSDGLLVGIVASGGEGRYEAIAADEIDHLRRLSGPEHAGISAETGAAMRICAIKLDEARANLRELQENDAKAIETSCGRSNNRQNLDLAAQALAQGGRIEAAVSLYQQAVDIDPNAINSRLGLTIALHIATRYEDMLPHLRHLMSVAGEDPQVLRLSIQAGTWGGDPELAAEAYETLVRVNPQMAPAAKRFLDNPPPRPNRRPERQ